MKILTIIVPGYNIYNTLDDLMKSLLIPSIMDLMEILVINDGSSDDTSQKAHQYEDSYSCCVKVIDKENGGHGSVLNYGIMQATGKYIQVIDGDDWVNSNNFEFLVNILKKTNCDMILCPWTEYYTNNDTFENKTIAINNKEIECYKEYTMEEIVNHLGIIGMVSVIYRVDVLRNNSIKIDENVFYDDNEFVLYPLVYINTIMFIDQPVYVYRLGQATQSVAPINYWKRRSDHETVVKSIVKFFNNITCSSNKATYFEWYVTKVVISHYYVYINYGEASREAMLELHQFDQWLKDNSIKIYRNIKANKVRLLRITRFKCYRSIMHLPK